MQSWKLLKGLGWEVVPVPYTGFPSGVKGNLEKMQQAAHMALEQAEEMLQDIEWRVPGGRFFRYPVRRSGNLSGERKTPSLARAGDNGALGA